MTISLSERTRISPCYRRSCRLPLTFHQATTHRIETCVNGRRYAPLCSKSVFCSRHMCLDVLVSLFFGQCRNLCIFCITFWIINYLLHSPNEQICICFHSKGSIQKRKETMLWCCQWTIKTDVWFTSNCMDLVIFGLKTRRRNHFVVLSSRCTADWSPMNRIEAVMICWFFSVHTHRMQEFIRVNGNK